MKGDVELNKIIILIGASGSGKTTIRNELEKHGVQRVVSFTTRKPRDGEVNGVDYNFITSDDINYADLAESTTYHGETYGVYGEEIESKLKLGDVCYVADRKGEAAIRALYPEHTLTFWLSISQDEMRERLRARGEKPQFIEARVEHARENDEFFPPFSPRRHKGRFITSTMFGVKSVTNWILWEVQLEKNAEKTA